MRIPTSVSVVVFCMMCAGCGSTVRTVPAANGTPSASSVAAADTAESSSAPSINVVWKLTPAPLVDGKLRVSVALSITGAAQFEKEIGTFTPLPGATVPDTVNNYAWSGEDDVLSVTMRDARHAVVERDPGGGSERTQIAVIDVPEGTTIADMDQPL